MVNPAFSYYEPHLTGLKTGTSTLSGYCVIVTAEYEGHTYLAGTFGSHSDLERCKDIFLLLEQFVPEELKTPTETVPAT